MPKQFAEFLQTCSPANADFFASAAAEAEAQGFKVGKGRTRGRHYYVVRVKTQGECGFVSFWPDALEIYFHKLCDRGYLSGEKAMWLEDVLLEQGFASCERHAHGSRSGGYMLLADLGAECSPSRRAELLALYRAVLEYVAAFCAGDGG